jgi:hypothetical protein
MLQARVAELDTDLRQARAKIEALTVDAGRVKALEALLENERQRVEEWKAVADRWAVQAERLSEQRRSWWPWRRSA